MKKSIIFVLLLSLERTANPCTEVAQEIGQGGRNRAY